VDSSDQVGIVARVLLGVSVDLPLPPEGHDFASACTAQGLMVRATSLANAVRAERRLLGGLAEVTSYRVTLMLPQRRRSIQIALGQQAKLLSLLESVAPKRRLSRCEHAVRPMHWIDF
jgi:hypothetical protein